MRTPIEALKEIRDRLTYFCLRTDGKYNPPWATELVGIIDDAVTDSHAVGNAAAMREALDMVLRYLQWLYAQGCTDRCRLSDEIDRVVSAIGELPRNCDVGTAEEQEDRFLDFCSEHHDTGCYDCYGNPICPVASESECRLGWAQMPYEAEEGGAK